MCLATSNLLSLQHHSTSNFNFDCHCSLLQWMRGEIARRVCETPFLLLFIPHNNFLSFVWNLNYFLLFKPRVSSRFAEFLKTTEKWTVFSLNSFHCKVENIRLKWKRFELKKTRPEWNESISPSRRKRITMIIVKIDFQLARLSCVCAASWLRDGGAACVCRSEENESPDQTKPQTITVYHHGERERNLKFVLTRFYCDVESKQSKENVI